MTRTRLMAGLGCLGLLTLTGCFDEPDREQPLDGGVADAGDDAATDAAIEAVRLQGSVVASDRLAGSTDTGADPPRLVGARVQALSQAGEALGVAVTDGNGEFSLNVSPGDPALLRVADDGFFAMLGAVPREADVELDQPVELLPREDVTAAVRAGTAAGGDEQRDSATHGIVVARLNIEDVASSGASVTLDAEHDAAFHILPSGFVGGSELVAMPEPTEDAGAPDAGAADGGLTADAGDPEPPMPMPAEVDFVFPNVEPGEVSLELGGGCTLDDERSPLSSLPVQPNTITLFHGSCD